MRFFSFAAVSARALAPLGLLALPSLAEAAMRDPSGVWLTEDGKARIKVEKCGARLCGYAVWLRTPLNDQGQPRLDFRNPDAKKRTRHSLGHQLIMGLRPNEEGKHEGKIYNAEDGKFYDVTVWSEEAGELTVRGCLIAFLCKSQTWTLKSDVAPGQLAGPTNGPNGPRADAEFGGARSAAAPAPAGSAAKDAAKASAQRTAAPKPAEPNADE